MKNNQAQPSEGFISADFFAEEPGQNISGDESMDTGSPEQENPTPDGAAFLQEFFEENESIEPPEELPAHVVDIEGTKYDLTNPQQREQASKIIKELTEIKPKFSELSSKKTEIETTAQQMKDAIRLMYSQQLYEGAVNPKNLQPKPFELFLEAAGGDRTKAMEMWNNDQANIRRTQEFAEKFSESAQKLVTMKQEFAKKYPDVGDVDKWVTENITPFLEPVMSYGEKPLHPELFDMVYFWKNKNTILQQFKDRLLKEYASKPVSRKPVTKSVATPQASNEFDPTNGEISSALQRLRKKYEGSKLLINHKP